MNGASTPRKAMINDLRSLLKDNDKYQLLFQFLAERSRDRNPITVEKMLSATKHKINRGDIVQICRVMDQLNLGNFIAGRRSAASRFTFYYTPTSVGRVALGQSVSLEAVPQPIIELAVDGHKNGDRVPPTLSNGKFHVYTGSQGITFMLPKTATQQDATKMANYIRKNFSQLTNLDSKSIE